MSWGSDGINPGQYLADSNNNFHLCSKYAITMHHANNTNYINNTTNIPYIHTKWCWTQYDCAVPMPSDSISASKKQDAHVVETLRTQEQHAHLGDVRCTTLCTCKGCTNTYGVRPPPSTTRKRQSYDNQRQPLRGIPSHEFMLDKGELNTDGHLTTLEILLLKSIVIYFILHGFDVSVQNIFYVYKQIYSVSLQCELVEFPLFERNIEHIQQFLSKLFCIIQILNSLLKLS